MKSLSCSGFDNQAAESSARGKVVSGRNPGASLATGPGYEDRGTCSYERTGSEIPGRN